MGYRAAVAAGVEAIAAGKLTKLVLARDAVAELGSPVAVAQVLRELALRYGDCWTYAVDGLIGSTPEMLVEVVGRTARARVLAGTLDRAGAPAGDPGYAHRMLAGDEKQRHEHQIAIDSLTEQLFVVIGMGRSRRTGSSDAAAALALRRPGGLRRRRRPTSPSFSTSPRHCTPPPPSAVPRRPSPANSCANSRAWTADRTPDPWAGWTPRATGSSALRCAEASWNRPCGCASMQAAASWRRRIRRRNWRKPGQDASDARGANRSGAGQRVDFVATQGPGCPALAGGSVRFPGSVYNW